MTSAPTGRLSTYSETAASRSTEPSSTNCITITAVNTLEMLPTRTRSSGSSGSPEAASSPVASSCTVRSADRTYATPPPLASAAHSSKAADAVAGPGSEEHPARASIRATIAAANLGARQPAPFASVLLNFARMGRNRGAHTRSSDRCTPGYRPRAGHRTAWCSRSCPTRLRPFTGVRAWPDAIVVSHSEISERTDCSAVAGAPSSTSLGDATSRTCRSPMGTRSVPQADRRAGLGPSLTRTAAGSPQGRHRRAS